MITCGTRTVMGNSFIGENALPKFRNRNHMMPLDGQKLLPEELEGYGYETGDRCLPYKWQDLFSRKLVETAIKTIVLENNLDDLIKLYKYCIDMEFDFLSISFLRNNNWKQNSVLQESFIPEYTANYPVKLYFDMEHFKEVFKEIQSLQAGCKKSRKPQLRFSPKFEYASDTLVSIEKFFNLPPDKPVNEIYKPCTYPYNNMMINPEGFVYPCLSQKIGNIRDKSLKELFNSPRYCCFRKNLKASGGVFGACQMCCELEVNL